MSSVEILNVQKHYTSFHALKNINLTIEKGEFIVMVGPSGCGKSTLLKTIAGLETISSGKLMINGRDVTKEEPGDRGIAVVFQSYALYPHMTAYENMAFGLKLAKTDKGEIDRRVRAAAEALSITDYLDRKPKAMSGGQRQRVAIGRAIVREPEVFLFDEPLSNLDAALRVRMRYEFARLHAELKTTMIYVTHDQVEAMTLADRIVVLNSGRIEQVGAPMDLYEHPANLFVAGFIGSPKMNLLAAEIVEASATGATVKTSAGETIRVSVDAASAKLGDAVTLGVRPEHLTTTGDGDALTAEAMFVETLGATTMAHLKHPASEDTLTVQLAGELRAKAGERLTLHVPAKQAHLFDAAGKAFQRL